MGETAAETLTEIAASRQRLASDLDALRARLPPDEELAAKARGFGGAAAGAGVAVTGLVVALRRHHATRQRRRQVRETAEALAELLEVHPDGVATTPEPGRSRSLPLALVAALVGVAVAVVKGRRSG